MTGIKKGKQIKITSDSNNIQINIPVKLLIRAAKHHPDGSIKIVKGWESELAKEVASELENNKDDDTGLTKLQQLLDDVMLSIAESGYEFIIYED